MTIINVLACIFATIRAFGWATNGVKRDKIIHFAEMGWIATFVLALALSFIQKKFLLLAWLGDSFGAYVIATIVFRIIFRKIKRSG